MRLTFAHPLHMVMGLVIWGVWYVAVYSGLSVACQLAAPPADAGPYNWINAALLAFTVPAIVLLFTLALRCWRSRPASGRQQHFNRRIAAAVYAAGGAATAMVGAPLMVLPPCV